MLDLSTGSSTDSQVHKITAWTSATRADIIFGTGDMFMLAV